jgi:type I restriction enzyme S subunit
MNSIWIEKAAAAGRAQPLDTDIPEGWVSVPLRDIGLSRKGKKPFRVSEEQWSGAIPYIDIETLETGRPHRYADSASSVLANPGDIVVVWDGARCGLAGRVPIKGALGSTLAKIEFPLTNSEYLLRFLQSQFDTINSEPRGTGIPHVEPLLFWGLEVPLCPLIEQQRIVAKIEKLLAQVNATIGRLARVAQILKRFRQSVLAAACSGRLTEDWRENYPSVEPASNLLLRIKDIRRASAQTRKEREQLLDAYDPKSSELLEDNFPIDSIPHSWTVCSIGAIGSVCNGSTPSRKLPEYWKGTIPWVSSGEVQNNIIYETRERITRKGYDSCSVRLLAPGTVLIAMIGEGKTRGQAAILQIEATINQNIAAVQLGHGLVVPEYLWYWFQFQYESTRREGGGTGPQALNCQRVRELPFVLPPLEEQHEIVRRVEALFARADAIEKQIAAATKRADKLTQAILAKAFRGELVPTEAELARREGRNYEPASTLLARIRSGRSIKTNGRPGVRKST